MPGSGAIRSLLLALGTTGLLCLAAVDAGGGAAPASKESQARQAELRQVRGRIDAIKKSIDADVQRRDAITRELRRRELGIQETRNRLTALRSQRLAAEGRLRDLRAEQAQTEKQIESEREALAGELRLAYMNGRDERLRLLLNQQDPARLGRMLAYYSYLGEARAGRIAGVRDHLAHLALLEERIGAEVARLAALEQETSAQADALAQARASRGETLAELQDSLQSRTEQLARLESDARTLARLIEQLRRAAEDFPVLAPQPFARVQGRLPWPAKGRVLARFGQTRAGGPLKWQGLLIATSRGTQVRAPFHGRVIYADWLPGMGLLVVLDHGGGYMSLYGHNEQLFKAVGDRVEPGDVIAAAGDSGGNANAGLYMEIRKDGAALDPQAWLVRP